jgi:hypothetical protein
MARGAGKIAARWLGALVIAALAGSSAAAREHLPAAAYAYVGDAGNPATWKLPYRHADGSVDRRRLPLAIEAMIETYRGRRANVPQEARHAVLQKLAAAADEIGRMPPHAAHPAPLYRKLAAALAR